MLTTVNEGEGFDYDFTLVGKRGEYIQRNQMDSFDVVVYDRDTFDAAVADGQTQAEAMAEAIIDTFSILDGDNGSTMHDSNGQCTAVFDPAYQKILDRSKNYETHRAAMKARWDDGGGAKNWEVEIQVKNMNGVEVPGVSQSPSASASVSASPSPS